MSVVKSTDHKDETFRVKKQGKTVHIRAELQMISYKDKESGMFVSYVPSLEMSGYGDNKEEAVEMITETLRAYLSNLAGQSIKNIQVELAKYGWFRKNINTKIFRPGIRFQDLVKEKKIGKHTTVPVTLEETSK